MTGKTDFDEEKNYNYNWKWFLHLAGFLIDLVWWIHALNDSERAKLDERFYAYNKTSSEACVKLRTKIQDAWRKFYDEAYEAWEEDKALVFNRNEPSERRVEFTVDHQTFAEEAYKFCLHHGVHPYALKAWEEHQILWKNGLPTNKEE